MVNYLMVEIIELQYNNIEEMLIFELFLKS